MPVPGSSTAARRFDVNVTELAPGTSATVSGTTARAWKGDHPSGAPPLILRLSLAGKTIAYTGDTAWTPAIADAAADLLIAADMLDGRPGTSFECARDGPIVSL